MSVSLYKLQQKAQELSRSETGSVCTEHSSRTCLKESSKNVGSKACDAPLASNCG